MNTPTRTCRTCKKPLKGRSDRRYCSATCRVMGWAERRKRRIAKTVILLAFLLTASCPVQAGVPPDWHHIEQVIIGEAASEGYDGMYAVACVMRNREWQINGFSAAKRRDLDDFVRRQPARDRESARRALSTARSGWRDATLGATHYESTDFKTPYWAKDMIVTVQIGKHVFYKEDSP